MALEYGVIASFFSTITKSIPYLTNWQAKLSPRRTGADDDYVRLNGHLSAEASPQRPTAPFVVDRQKVDSAKSFRPLHRTPRVVLVRMRRAGQRPRQGRVL